MSESILNLKKDVMQRVYAIHVLLYTYRLFIKGVCVVGVLAIIAANVSFAQVWRNATVAGGTVRYLVSAIFGARLILMFLGTSFIALCGSAIADLVHMYRVRTGKWVKGRV
jgi:hypothetical protein